MTIGTFIINSQIYGYVKLINKTTFRLICCKFSKL